MILCSFKVSRGNFIAGRMSEELLSAEDYEAIAAAVMETERGRWFLREYAARNRNADTSQILDVLRRLEERMAAPAMAAPAAPPLVSLDTLPISLDEPPTADTSPFDANAIAQWIAEARHEMRSLREEAGHNGRILRDGDDFDAISAASDHAINSVLNAAERIQEMSWMLRERGIDAQACDELDQRASEIYLACSFQDTASRRLASLVETFTLIDQHISQGLQQSQIVVPRLEHEFAELEHDISAPERPKSVPDELTANKVETKAPLAVVEAAAIIPHAQPVQSKRPHGKSQNHGKPQNLGNLALVQEVDEDILIEARPAWIAGIDYSELSFNEKIALFS